MAPGNDEQSSTRSMSDRVNLNRVIRLSLPFNFRFAPKATPNREGNRDQVTRREYEIPIESAYFISNPVA